MSESEVRGIRSESDDECDDVIEDREREELFCDDKFDGFAAPDVLIGS
jgi:hypothetical protein